MSILLKNIILFVVILSSQLTFAHKNINIKKEFGNVKVIFTTGYYYEEINKGLIIGEYAQQLSKELAYNKPIIIWFKHIYYDFKNPEYTIEKTDKNIFITLNDYCYDVKNVLRILTYTITHALNASIVFNPKKSNSLKLKDRSIIDKLLKKKIYRPRLVKELGNSDMLLSYYTQNNKFYIFYKTKKGEELVDTVNEIYQISSIDKETSVYFTKSNKIRLFTFPSSKESFTIEKINKFKKPFRLKKLTSTIISIVIMPIYKDDKERIVVLNRTKKKIYQNLEVILDGN